MRLLFPSQTFMPLAPAPQMGDFAARELSRRWFFIVTILIAAYSCWGREHTILSFDFDQNIPPVRTLSGSWQKDPSGLLLKENSRISIQSDSERGIINGRIDLGFRAPVLEKSILLMKERTTECLCALKLTIGRCLAEVTEKGVSLKILDESFGSVESILGSVELPFDPHGGDLTLSFAISDKMATVCLNDSICVSGPATGYWFGAIEIASYNTPFVLTSYSLTSLSRDTVLVDAKKKYLDLACVYHPSHFNSGSGQHNHSFIVHEGGTAAYNALFTIAAPESAVYKALLAIGAKPGNNLRPYPWSKIYDTRFTSPDEKSKGSPLSIQVLYGGKSSPASSIVRDENNKHFNFRFSGNEMPQHASTTGCVVCLESCPLGKIGNASYSMRDMIKKTALFSALPDLPFTEADEATIRISLVPEGKIGK